MELRPPNLRQAPLNSLMEGVSCASCRHFRDDRCRLYGDWPVKPNDISDSYEPSREPRRQPV
jgi:hypothetical protein